MTLKASLPRWNTICTNLFSSLIYLLEFYCVTNMHQKKIAILKQFLYHTHSIKIPLSEFDSLLSKLLEQKPDITKAQIDELIQRKKEKIGAGYLTDQGALFLIASDLGVSLSEPLKVEMGLKDLYVGAKEITLATRVMNVYPVKQFSRKDGSQFLLRTMTV